MVSPLNIQLLFRFRTLVAIYYPRIAIYITSNMVRTTNVYRHLQQYFSYIRAGQLHCWNKPEYSEKNIVLPKVYNTKWTYRFQLRFYGTKRKVWKSKDQVCNKAFMATFCTLLLTMCSDFYINYSFVLTSWYLPPLQYRTCIPISVADL